MTTEMIMTFPKLIQGKQIPESRYCASHSFFLPYRPNVYREHAILCKDKLGKYTTSTPDFALLY